MACGLCGVCASCKGSCRCGFRSSQARLANQVLAYSNLTKEDSHGVGILKPLILARRSYQDIREILISHGYVFKDTAPNKKVKVVEKIESPIVAHEGCYATVAEGSQVLGLKGGLCDYDGIGAWGRCRHCNSLRFYQKSNICLAITNNLCQDADAVQKVANQ